MLEVLELFAEISYSDYYVIKSFVGRLEDICAKPSARRCVRILKTCISYYIIVYFLWLRYIL